MLCDIVFYGRGHRVEAGGPAQMALRDGAGGFAWIFFKTGRVLPVFTAFMVGGAGCNNCDILIYKKLPETFY